MNKKLKYMLPILILFQAIAVLAVFAEDDNPVSSNDTTPALYEENLKRWQGMSEEERESIRQKVQAIDPQQRKVIRENAKRFKQLPAEDRSRIEGNFHKFKELPRAKREFLREEGRRFHDFPPEKRAELRRGAREKRERRESIQNRPEEPRDRRNDSVDRKEGLRLRRDDVGDRGSVANRKNPPGPRGDAGVSSGRKPNIDKGSGMRQGRQGGAKGPIIGRGPGGGGKGGSGLNGIGRGGKGPGGGRPGGGIRKNK